MSKKIKQRLAALEAEKARYEWAARVLKEHTDDATQPKKARKREKRQRKTFQRFGGDFLQSYEWRRLRMEAIKKHGARCQCCGASPADGAVLNVDHIKPRKFFPELALTLSNLQVLCHDCNHGKGNWDMTDWREKEKA